MIDLEDAAWVVYGEYWDISNEMRHLAYTIDEWEGVMRRGYENHQEDIELVAEYVKLHPEKWIEVMIRGKGRIAYRFPPSFDP